jgi:predicted DNA-binding protein
MNISQNNLNELINLYLNDVEDYSTEEFILAESVLKPIKQLIVESKYSPSEILKETIKKSTPTEKKVIEDFITYVKEI